MPEDASLDQFATANETDDDESAVDATSKDPEPEADAESEADDAVTEELAADGTESTETNDSTTDDSGSEDPKTAESVGAAETEASAGDGSDVTPAVSTYSWSPEGGDCADCGESVERRWRADGQRDGELVCEDCKEW